MILKLTTNDKASIWVNLSRILQMTLIDTQAGYPKTQIVMDNGAVICVFETPDDIAQWTKSANAPCSGARKSGRVIAGLPLLRAPARCVYRKFDSA